MGNNKTLSNILYFYKIDKVLKILDGDTIEASIDVGFNTYRKEKIRF